MKRSKLLLVLVGVVALLAALPLACDSESRDVGDARSGVEGSFVTLGDGVVHYRLTGPEDGPPVVLVHGFSVPSFSWEDVAGRLEAAGFRVLRYDLYGRGWSDRPDADYGPDLYDRQLAQLLDQLDMTGPVDVVGISMGGAISARFCENHPERVGKLALISPFVGTGGLPFTAHLVQLPVLGPYLMSVAGERIMLGRLEKNFSRPGVYERIRPTFVEQMSLRGYKRALRRTTGNFIALEQSAAYGAAGRGREVLLIWGTEDAVVPYPNHETILSAIPDASFVSLEGYGHMPNLEDPELVVEHLQGFLQGG